MSVYVKKIINYLSKGANRFITEKDLMNVFALTKEEYEELLDYEISVIKKIRNRYFTTTDLDYVGSYDFQFVLTHVNKGKGTHSEFNAIMVFFDILPGGLVTLNGQPADIDEDLIQMHEWGWEIESEIKDIFYTLIQQSDPLFRNTFAMDAIEIYINYPE